MESPKHLYPTLNPDITTITEDELIQRINASKNKDRIRYMKDKQNDLTTKLKHYKKLKHRWVIARRILQGVGITITTSLSLGTIVTTIFLTPPLIPIILTGVGIFSLTMLSTLDKSVFNIREKSLRKKQHQNKEILNKLHYYFEKCRDDNIITLEEMEAFDKINKSIFNNVQNDNFLEELVNTLKSMPEGQLKSLLQKT